MVEAVIASALVGIIAAASLQGVELLLDNAARHKKLTAQNRVTRSLISVIQSNLHLFRVSPIPFDPGNNAHDRAIEAELQFSNATLAWTNFTLKKAEDCRNCPGRLAYVIQRVPMLPNLYFVNLRVWEDAMRAPEKNHTHRFIANIRH